MRVDSPKWAGSLLLAALVCDPQLTRLFTPLHPQLGHYQVCADPRSIQRLVADAGRDRVHYGGLEAVEPLDAFGVVGAYDRAALRRLYGGKRVTVARGWALDGTRFESVTLVSPHPDASLSRLEPGTLAIRWVLDLSAGPIIFRPPRS